jgi:hypothetical protein
MEENVQQAQSELDSLTETAVPQSLDEVVAGLQGFGIEDFEEILTLQSVGRKIRIRLSNIATEDEMVALMAVEGQKGYAWTQRIKCEILSRAISWIALGDGPGVNLRTLSAEKRISVDPKDGLQKDIQVVLRNLITGWGEELVGVLWKVFMVHAQRIEDRLTQAFPDSAVMTEVEKRFMATALAEIDDATKNQIRETVAEIFKEDGEAAEETPAPAPAAEVKV